MSKTTEFKPWGAPKGEARMESPDGVTFSDGMTSHNSLRDGSGQPNTQSGDYQTNVQNYAPNPGKITE